MRRGRPRTPATVAEEKDIDLIAKRKRLENLSKLLAASADLASERNIDGFREVVKNVSVELAEIAEQFFQFH